MEDVVSNDAVVQRNIALLVDGDNAQPKLIEKMMRETEKYGTITIRRIYGDWTTPNMNGWKETLHTHAIQPIQQFRYTVGKNATDSALIIDAMDILHANLVGGFCIISSDSDYTRLATRIREDGIFVMGIGEKKTPKAFVKSCDVFVYTENISPTTPKLERKVEEKGSKGEALEEHEVDPKSLLVDAFDMVVQEDGWVNLGPLGAALRKIDPGFDPRTYGYKQLSKLIKAYPDLFEVKYKDETGQTTVYVRLKE